MGRKYGTWSAHVYELAPALTAQNVEWDEEIDGWIGPKLGVNIHLSFRPHNNAHARVRLVQFKLPATSSIWEVDRSRTYHVPYFGFDDHPRPLPVADIGDMQSLAPVVGQPLVGESCEAHQAFLVDSVREPVTLPKPGRSKKAIFVTYAYDAQEAIWLGGVSWGYTVSAPKKLEERPVMELNAPTLRSDGSPHGHAEEKGAIAKWNAIPSVEHVPE
ncbi:hypothetical protein KJ359_011647 [Pestalotiopsis sp. 9143b]|nr:hypothetical protein KJ359_011647 [Pestalotiopsis sp. 9143b]